MNQNVLIRQVNKANKVGNGRWNIFEDDNNDLRVYTANFIPPEGSVYHGGVFFVNITFPQEFPMYPPRVKMTTRIYHPNFSQSPDHMGCMYTNNLYDDYTMGMTVTDLMEYIYGLFTTPDTDSLSQCNSDAYNTLRTNPKRFEKNAREWTIKYT